jgi:hypothetical protein
VLKKLSHATATNQNNPLNMSFDDISEGTTNNSSHWGLTSATNKVNLKKAFYYEFKSENE